MSSASGSYPGAMIPSETSREMILAVATSQVCERAMKSPNEDMRSAPRARAYALATGERDPRPSTSNTLISSCDRVDSTAHPAGETCLNEAAAALAGEKARESSWTRAYELSASRRLMYPGDPDKTVWSRDGMREPLALQPERGKVERGLAREGKFALGHVGLSGFLVRVGTVAEGELLGALGQVGLLFSGRGRDGIGRDVLTTEVVRDRSVVRGSVGERLRRREAQGERDWTTTMKQRGSP